MELVLGLATLATAVSGMASAGHINDASEFAEAETATSQITESFSQKAELLGGSDLPESRIGDFDGFGKVDLEGFSKADLLKIDENGNNNTVKRANLISGLNNQNGGFSGSAPSVQEGTIRGQIKTRGDVDWFRFTVFGKANVEMTLSRPFGSDYRIGDVQKMVETTNEAVLSNSSPLQIESVSFDGSNTPVNLNGLYPGAYYVKIESPQNNYSDSIYSLKVKITYEKEDVLIDDYVSIGAKAAIWISDYDPIGFKPNTLSAEESVGEGGSKTSVRYWADTAFPLSLEQPRKQAELFLWDDAYKDSLKGFALALSNEVGSYFNNHSSKKNIYFEVSRGTNSSDANVIMYCKDYKWHRVTRLAEWDLAGCGSAVVLKDVILPKAAVFDGKNDVIEYLTALHDDIDESNSQDVIRIPVHYSVHYRSNFICGGDGVESEICYFYLGYGPVVQSNYVYDSNAYQNTIYASDYEGNNPINGTIYPLFMRANDLDLAFNRINRYDLTTEDLFLGQPSSTFKLRQYESKWFKFTAPTTGHFRIRSTGAWNAAVHVCNAVTTELSAYSDAVIAREYRTPGYDEGFSYDFDLAAGATLFFRVCGSLDDYEAIINDTTVTVTEIMNTIVNFNGYDIDPSLEWSNYHDSYYINNPVHIDIESQGTFLNLENGFVTLKVDRDDICDHAFLKLTFNRPIKTLSFSTCIANSYSYAALGLYVHGLDTDGDAAVVDVTGFWNDYTFVYGDYYLSRYVLNYDTEERDVGVDIYSVVFVLDPDTDTSPYHVSYQEQWLHDFTVEFAD